MKLDPDRPRTLLLERARKALGATTDADLARHMRVTPQTLSQWKSGQVAMTDERVIQMAEIAGDAPELWLLLMSYANAKTPKTRRIWALAATRAAAQIDGLAKVLAIAIVIALPWANPAIAHPPGVSASTPEIGIMRSVLAFIRRLLGWRNEHQTALLA